MHLIVLLSVHGKKEFGETGNYGMIRNCNVNLHDYISIAL